MHRLVAFAALSWFATTPAYADQAPKPVTFADVLAALPATPAATANHHDIDAADALIDAAGAWPNPSLRLETNRLTAQVVAGITLPLPFFGTVGATRRAASAQARAVRAEAIVNQREVRNRAISAWIALARADGELEAVVTAATQAGELERIAIGRLDAGVGADVDVTTAKAARARAELAVAMARRAQQAASAELAGILAWDPMTPLVSAGELPGRETVAIESLRSKLAAHPQHMLAVRRIGAAEASVAQVRALRKPGLAVEAQVSALDPETPGTDVMVALSIELPLFARVGDRARSARATAAAERARLAMTDAQLSGALVAAYRRWQAAAETLDALGKDILPAHERAAKLSADAYREGARDLGSAIQADRDLAAVRAEVSTARADLATAWTNLEEAAGAELGASRAH